MDDLVVWLRQQLDDDERVARGASADQGSPWCAIDGDDAFVSTESGGVIRDGDYGGHLVVAEHIARHDPARVLREVEAKKRRLDEFAKARGWLFAEEDPTVQVTVAAMCATWDKAIRIDAAVYAERPGYREQWKP